MNLSRFALKNQAIVIGATFVLCVAGIATFLTAPRREDPEFKIRTCIVRTAWPGAAAVKVEQLITDPIEREVDDIDGVKRVRSASMVGYSVVYVDLEDAIQDVEQLWDEVRAKVTRIAEDLPQGSMPPEVDTDFGDTSAMVLAVYQVPPPGKSTITRPYTPRELEVIADRLGDELKLHPAIAQVDLYGVREEVIYVEADAGRWGKLDQTMSHLGRLLAARNIVAPGGTIDTDLGRFGVRPSGELNAVDEINRIVTGDNSKRVPVYLKDLGLDVVRTYRDPPKTLVRFGRPDVPESVPAIVVSFTMKSGRNITTLGEEVKAMLPVWSETILPRDIEVAIVSDQPRIVDETIQNFFSNLFQAMAIVVLVAYLLIGLRIAIVMAAAIPMVLLTSLGIVPIFGVELEQASIASLIISLGLLVDCAIEVADNIHRHMEEGSDRLTATVEGARQIAFPVLIATLTTAFAFLPMLTLPGSSGEYVRSIPVVVSTTLGVSWILAMTITALMAYWVIRPARQRRGPASPLARLLGLALRLVGRRPAEGSGYAWIAAIYTPICRFCLRNKLLVLAATFVAFSGALALVATGLVGTQFFPPAFRDQFLIEIYLPERSPISRTAEVCLQVEGIVREASPATIEGKSVERIRNFASYVGVGGPRFFMSLDPGLQASNYAAIVVNTSSPYVVDPLIQEIRREVTGRVAGARVVPSKLIMGPPVKYPVTLRVVGEDIERLPAIAAELKEILRRAPGAVDVNDSWGRPGYQLAVDVDEDRAKLAGVTNASVAQSLNAFYSGYYMTTFREGDHQVPVYLRLPLTQRASLDGLPNLPVEGIRGKVPLNAVARIEAKWQPSRIERYRKQRTIEARSQIEEGVLANSVLSAAWPEIEALQAGLPPGYRIEIGGEMEKTIEEAGNMQGAFRISVVLIIMCLVVQYNSFSKPIIILLTIPMAATGAFAGLYLTGKPLGFMAQLGLLSLVGVVLNDGIVLIEFVELKIRARLERGEGLAAPGERSYAGLGREGFRECIVEGARLRILPIFLTTLTTVGGLIPLAIFGGPLWESMAVVLIFGLLLATLLTLLVLPTIYAAAVEVFRIRVIQRPIEGEAGTGGSLEGAESEDPVGEED